MKRFSLNLKDILIGLAILAVLAGVVYFVRRPKTPPLTVSNLPQVEEKIEKTFNVTIPDNVERADLAPGGDEIGTGLATRKYEGGKFNLTVLAELADPASGYFYQVWLKKDDQTLLAIGRLRIAKGGFLLEFTSATDYSDYQGVVVSLENKAVVKPTKLILEGSFK